MHTWLGTMDTWLGTMHTWLGTMHTWLGTMHTWLTRDADDATCVWVVLFRKSVSLRFLDYKWP